MSGGKIYDERALVEAYVDAQRPPYPHEDFRKFRRARLAALENAYGIRLTVDGASGPGQGLWLLFHATVQSYLGLSGPRAGFLEDGLINSTIERVDTPSLALRATEDDLHRHLAESRRAHLGLLVGLFKVLWGPLERPLGSAELRARGFDDSSEPQLVNYYNDM